MPVAEYNDGSKQEQICIYYFYWSSSYCVLAVAAGGGGGGVRAPVTWQYTNNRPLLFVWVDYCTKNKILHCTLRNAEDKPQGTLGVLVGIFKEHCFICWPILENDILFWFFKYILKYWQKKNYYASKYGEAENKNNTSTPTLPNLPKALTTRRWCFV